MSSVDIIVIDDDPITLEIIEDMLSSTKYSVLTYDDPSDGLEGIKANKPQLVISDYNMPDFSGQKLLIKVSEALVFGKSTFVLLSAQTFDDSERMLLATCGFTHILTKPISKKKLLELVETVMSEGGGT